MSESPDRPKAPPAVPNGHSTASSAKKKRSGGKNRPRPDVAKPRERVTPGGPRHLARITAMQVLFEIDVADHSATEVLTRTFEDPEVADPDDREDGPMVPDASLLQTGDRELLDIQGRVERLVRGVMENFHEIDPYIADAAPAFPIDQLPAVDRNVLRLATYELLREPEVPPRAAINEAVELAKRFGGDTSGRFVNGVLGTVSAKIERERTKQPEREPATTAGEVDSQSAPNA